MGNLFRDLQQAWNTEGESSEARAALARWAEHRPELHAFTSPAHLLRACHSRSNPTARRLVDELTEEAAHDAWATRTVLQAVLPGLGAMARQHRSLANGGREPFSSIAELDQFLVCTAYERIPAVAAEQPHYRINTILDSTWTRLRSHAAAHRRDVDSRVPLDEANSLVAAPSRTDAEELALTLVDAVERRVLRTVDARLLYATRVAGHSAADLADTLDWQTASLLRRRHRVQQVMAAEVLGEPRPRHGCVAPAKVSA